MMARNFGLPPREQSSTAFTGATINALVVLFVFGVVILNAEKIAEFIHSFAQ